MDCPVDIESVEEIFRRLEQSHPDLSDTPDVAFLDRISGAVVRPATDADLERYRLEDRFLSFPREESGLDRYEAVLDFIDSREDGGVRILLGRTTRGRGALRRFRDLLNRDERLWREWQEFATKRRRERMADWLESAGFEVDRGILCPD